MLSNALNFLSDKRRRFHRSDTMPAFKSINCSENNPPNANSSTSKDVTSEQGKGKPSQSEQQPQSQLAVPTQEEFSDRFKPVAYTSNLTTTSATTTTASTTSSAAPHVSQSNTLKEPNYFVPSTTSSTSTSTPNTSSAVSTISVGMAKRLTTETFAQSECDLTRPSGGTCHHHHHHHHHRGERVRGSPSKLETLSLPLQSHIPLDALTTDHLGGSYSLSPSPLSFGSSGSPNLHKDEDMRHVNVSSRSDVKFPENLQQTAQKISFLRDEQQEFVQVVDSPTAASIPDPAEINPPSNLKNSTGELKKPTESKEFANYVTSARNRVAQIRAKAGGKSKLQRSNSSAQVLRRSRDPIQGNEERVRATSIQREVISSAAVATAAATTTTTTPNTGPVELDVHPREQSVDRKRRGRRRGKTWMDRGPRSRSVTTPFHKERSPCSSEPSKPNLHVLTELAKRATSEQCCKICVSSIMGAAQNGESRWTDTSVILGLQKHIQTATALTDPALGTHSQQLASHIATVQSRRNRYAVVRRLRRNNSSINWPADRPFPSVEAELNVPTSQTAGDLLLPSKDVLMEKTRRAQEQENMQILNDLFVWIEQNNVEQIVEHHQKLALLKEELSSSDQSVRSEIGLNPLDYAVLLASPQTIALLIMLGFRPGAMLSVALEHGPANVRVTDPMKFFLTRRIGDVEAKISTAQVCLDTAVSRANAYSLIQRDPNVTDWDQSAMSEAFTEVAQKEMDLQRAVKHRDKLVELRNALDRYPPTPPAPSKVVLMVYSARSILVRVSPPRQSRLRVNVTKSTTVVESSELRDTTSCESSSPETGRSPFEGRKVAGFEIDSYGLLVIRYRIEWSLSADFQNDVFSCTVAPPIRLTSIVPDSKKPDTSARLFVRTGFYELDGFQSGQNVYVRVYAFTVRGWSEPCYAQPRFVAPSSWIDALQRSKENSETTEKTIPLRYGAEIFSEKFQALKKLLDQQLLIWTYRQPSTSNPCEAIAGSEEGGKRTRSPMIQRKRSFRFPFTTKGMKFVRQTKTGVYLALVCHSTPSSTVSISDRETLDKSQLILVDDFIPMVCVTKEEPNLGAQTSADMNWFSRLLAQPKFGTDLQLISENLLRSTTPANLQFRFLLLTALQRMQIALGTYDVGVLYPDWFSGRLIESNISSLVTELSEFSLSTTGVRTADDMTEGVANTPAPSTPVSQPETSSKSTQNSLILVLVKHVQNPNDVTCSGGFRWYPLHKFLRQNKLNPADFTLVGTEVTPSPKISVTESESGGSSRNVPMRPDLIYLTPELHLLSNLDVLLYYSERRQNKLDPGLYVSLIQMHAHFDHQAKILSSKTSNVIHMLPVERVRRRTHVCRSEWNTLYNLLVATDPDAVSNPGSTTHMVVNEPYALRFCRKLHNAWIRLAKRLNYTDDELLDFRFYLPEVIQISPQHALILIFPKTDQVCLPPGHSTTPPPSNCSWIFMAYFERNLGMIYDPIFYNTASSLMSMLEVLIPMSTLVQRQCIADSELGQCVERTNTLQSIYHQVDSAFQEKRWLSEVISAARDRKRPHALTLLSRTLKMFVDSVIRRMDNGRYGLRVLGDLGEISLGRSDWKDVLYLGSPSTLNEAIQIVERKTNTHEVRNLLSVCHIPRDRAINEVTKEVPPVVNHDRQVSVVRVYAGYATGLGSGASVKVLISVRATARDIVEVVVAKLNRTLEAKRQHLTQKHRLTNPVHVPTFETIESDRFCLTVSLGTTERLIPDTIRPLLLQEPWRSGKLYVRLIHELQQYISSNSPTRLYLAVEDQIAAISKDNLETVSFLLSPMRSERAKFSSTEDVFHWVKKSGPPTIYMDGRPVK